MGISPLKLDRPINFDVARMDIISQSPLFTPQKKISLNRNLHSNILKTPNSSLRFDNDYSPFDQKLKRKIDFSTRSPMSKRNDSFYYKDNNTGDYIEQSTINNFSLSCEKINNTSIDHTHQIPFQKDSNGYMLMLPAGNCNDEIRYFEPGHLIISSHMSNSKANYQPNNTNSKRKQYKSPKKIAVFSDIKNNFDIDSDFNEHLVSNSQKQLKNNNSTIIQNNIDLEINSNESNNNNNNENYCLKCNCKNSKCLKLYCECFRIGLYCCGCNCLNCRNLPEYEEERLKAIQHISARNPFAFKPKFIITNKLAPNKIIPYKKDLKNNSGKNLNISSVQEETRDDSYKNINVDIKNINDSQQKHYKGCNCKKSGCLKRYCECFQMGVECTEHCKCTGCKNCINQEKENDSNSIGKKTFQRKRSSPSTNSKSKNKKPAIYNKNHIHMNNFIADKTIEMNIFEKKLLLKNDSISKRSYRINKTKDIVIGNSNKGRTLNLNELFLSNSKHTKNKLHNEMASQNNSLKRK